MFDPYVSQAWAEHHGLFSEWAASVIDQVNYAFERLAARTYDAPWRARGPVRCPTPEPERC